MDIDRETFLALTVALAACHRTDAQKSPVDVPQAHLVPVARGSDFCAGLAAMNRKNWPKAQCPAEATLPQGYVGGLDNRMETWLADSIFFSGCTQGPKGAWGLKLTAPTEVSAPTFEGGPMCGLSGSYSIVFQAPGEQTQAIELPPSTWSYFADGERKMPAFMGRFDYDGDGRDELIFENTEAADQGRYQRTTNVVLSAPKDRIEPYGPMRSFAFSEVEDVDGDGRPDFLVPYSSTAEPCYGLAPTTIYGPLLLVHSLPDGTFTMSDSLCRRWARAECPDAPKAVEASSSPSMDAYGTASCARLWGQEPDDIAAPYRTALFFCDQSTQGELIFRFVQPPPPFEPLGTHTPQPLVRVNR